MSRLSTNAAQIAVVARGLADKGVLAPIDADVADAGHVTAEQARLDAEAALRRSELTLASLLGLPDAKATGELAPLQGVELARAVANLPEARAFAAEAKAQESAASAYSRARVPNPTLSLFVQNDGFDERVLGGGLSLPLYLPAPLGPGGAGEVQAARAEAEQAQAAAALARRRVREEVLRALAAERSYAAELPLVPAALEARARDHLDALARAIAARQVPLRDALLSQRSLLDLIEAERQQGVVRFGDRGGLLHPRLYP